MADIMIPYYLLINATKRLDACLERAKRNRRFECNIQTCGLEESSILS